MCIQILSLSPAHLSACVKTHVFIQNVSCGPVFIPSFISATEHTSFIQTHSTFIFTHRHVNVSFLYDVISLHWFTLKHLNICVNCPDILHSILFYEPVPKKQMISTCLLGSLSCSWLLFEEGVDDFLGTSLPKGSAVTSVFSSVWKC